MKKYIYLLLFIFVLSQLTGCLAPYRKASRRIAQTQQAIDNAQKTTEQSDPAVVMRSGYYVDDQPVSLKKTPRWLSKRVNVEAEKIPFSLLMTRLLAGSNANATYDNTVQSEQLINFNYRGPLKNALNQLGEQLNYAYSTDNNNVNWSAFVTKTFNVSFMPGSSNYLVGQSQNSSSGSSNYNSPFAASTSSSSTNTLDDDQYSNLQGQLSVWEDLRRTLEELKSKAGKIYVSQSTTSVTVHDRPSNVAAMANYIAKMNNSLSQEVGIKVEVLEIQLNHEYNSGIDWNAVIHTLGTTFRIAGNLASATNPAASNIISNSATSALASFEVQTDNTRSLLSALNKQGKLRVVTRPQVVTLNNQIASIRITQDTGYIQSVNSSFTQNYVTTSITPGSVTDGFTLYLLPKIQGQQVYMQISSVISNLLNLQKESTAPADTNPHASQQYSAIEVPTIAQKAFNQRSVVVSGHTLVIAGFKRLRDQTQEADFFGIKPLGGRGAESENVETLMLITPTILNTPK